jgi:hypothetical protein
LATSWHDCRLHLVSEGANRSNDLPVRILSSAAGKSRRDARAMSAQAGCRTTGPSQNGACPAGSRRSALAPLSCCVTCRFAEINVVSANAKRPTVAILKFPGPLGYRGGANIAPSGQTARITAITLFAGRSQGPRMPYGPRARRSPRIRFLAGVVSSNAGLLGVPRYGRVCAAATSPCSPPAVARCRR